MNFQQNLVRQMTRKRLTNAALARKVGVSSALISMWRNGKTLPSLHKAVLTAEAMGVKIHTLTHKNKTTAKTGD